MKYRLVLLPTAVQPRQLTTFAQRIPVHGRGFRLDKQHLPHITVVAFEVGVEDEALAIWENLNTTRLESSSATTHGIDQAELSTGGHILLHLIPSQSLRATFSQVGETLAGQLSEADFVKYRTR